MLFSSMKERTPMMTSSIELIKTLVATLAAWLIADGIFSLLKKEKNGLFPLISGALLLLLLIINTGN